MRGSQEGFTLIELLTVVAIIAILVAIAYPSYQEYVRRANRTEAKNLLLQIGAEQEKFFTTFNRYSGSIDGARTGNPATSGLNMANSTQDLEGGAPDPNDNAYYDIDVVLGGGNLAYTLTATPRGAVQVLDSCGALTLTNTGQRAALGAAAPDNCW